jgi:hypothetical protein
MAMLILIVLTAVALALTTLWILTRRRARQTVPTVTTARVSALRDTLERKVRDGER